MKKLFTLALSMLALNSFAQVLNPGMEDWHNYTANQEPLEAPDHWYGSDEATFWADTSQLGGLLISPVKQIFRSSTENTGTYAARIESHQILNFGTTVTSGVLSNAHITYLIGFLLDGGTPVTEQIPFVYAWTKYTAGAGNDTGMLVVTAVVTGSNGDSIVGTGVTDIPPSANYMQIGTVVQYDDANVVPERIQIAFYSSKGLNAEEDSQLWVDDVTWSTSSVKALAQSNVVKTYPNPSSGIVSVYNTLNEAVTMKVFTINGQQVAEKKFKGNDVIDLTAQANGLYFFTILDSNGQPVQNGKLTVAK